MIADAKRLTGPNASSAKYDVLTALALLALHRDAAAQASVLRLIAVITARYNWRRDELSMCQQDMAQMWGVSLRTAKRDVKRWLSESWMTMKRQGVRGRAGAYRLDFVEIGRQSNHLWPLVGPDFVERLTIPTPEENVIRPDFARVDQPTTKEPGTWAAVCERLRLSDQSVYHSWIAPLQVISNSEGHITLRAPSRFAANYVTTHLLGLMYGASEIEMGSPMKISVIA